jgi:uncharacterized protein
MQIMEKDGAVSFMVRVQPRASREEIAGEWQNAMKIRLMAPPVDDRANHALCVLFARCLKVSPAAVRITSGEHSRTRRVEIRGVTAAEMRVLLD